MLANRADFLQCGDPDDIKERRVSNIGYRLFDRSDARIRKVAKAGMKHRTKRTRCLIGS